MSTPGENPRQHSRRTTVGDDSARMRTATGRCGFSLIETVFALAVLSLTGAAVLNAIGSAVSSCDDSVQRSVARGLAEQLLDELAASRFTSGAPSGSGPATNRSGFTTIDDYALWSESPPRTKAGLILGTEQPVPGTTTFIQRPAALQARAEFLKRFARAVVVENVKPSGPGWTVTTEPTQHRRVTVLVTFTPHGGTARTVATQTRVFAAIPATP